MTKIEPSFFSDVLADNSAALTVRAELAVVEIAGDNFVLTSRSLDLERYFQLGFCELEPAEVPRAIKFRYWGGEEFDQLYDSFVQVVWNVTWKESQLQVFQLQWSTSCGMEKRSWVVTESEEIAEEFVLDVQRKTHAPGNTILVFSDGHWSRSGGLYKAMQAASFDDLVLANQLKEQIRTDFKRFLKSRGSYERLGIAWRRGALMIGPPGNGKTHCVRALVKDLSVPCLYVQSLSHNHFTMEQLWQEVFDRARGLTPCVLVLEDLDSLVNDQNRSFFLNQLDGFEQNHGLMVLATTNHPDRIDKAIIDRPSRFDRKYHFDLPTSEERQRYLEDWQEKLTGETGWNLAEVPAIATATEGFSFAYLKELIISTLMEWMHEPADGLASVMKDQVDLLNGQMRTEVDREKQEYDRTQN